jgi:hypothetical protein
MATGVRWTLVRRAFAAARSVLARRSPVELRVVSCLALCAATAALHLADIRYVTAQTSAAAGFLGMQWGRTPGVSLMPADPSVARLDKAPGQSVAYLVRGVNTFKGYDGIRVTAELRTEGVVAGPLDWQKARVLVWSYDEAGRRIRYLPHEVLALEGTDDWTRGRLVAPVVPQTVAMRVAILHGGEAGSVYVRNVAVDAVNETPLYAALRGVLIACWAAWALWVLYSIIRREGGMRPARLAAWAVALVLVTGSFLPQPYLGDATERVAAVLESASAPEAAIDATAGTSAPRPPAGATAPRAEGQASTPPMRARSVAADPSPAIGPGHAHFAAFLLLGALLPFAFPGASRRQLLGHTLLLAAAIELLQGFTVTRETELADFALDGAGAALGIGAVLAWERRIFRAPRGVRP